MFITLYRNLALYRTRQNGYSMDAMRYVIPSNDNNSNKYYRDKRYYLWHSVPQNLDIRTPAVRAGTDSELVICVILISGYRVI